MKKLIFVFITLIFSTTVCAESSVWKMSTEKGALYLAGSCHVLRKSDYPIPDEFESAYENAEQVIFETELEALMRPDIQFLLLNKGMYTEGDTLEKKLSDKTYKALVKFCNDKNIPIALFQGFKPWLLTMTLMTMELEKNGISSRDGLDMYFYNKAKQDGKNTGGLEDIHKHIELVSSLEEELDESVIESFIQEIAKLQIIMEDLIKSWRAGDEAKIDKFLAENMRKEYPKLYNRLIIARNRDWIDQLEALVGSDKRTLVIVGVGHLVGKNSVISLLKSKGYKIRKL